MSMFHLVKQFHHRFNLPCADRPVKLKQSLTVRPTRVLLQMDALEANVRALRKPTDEAWGRIQMMLEELREYAEAVYEGDLPAQADALVDLVYFALGTAAMQGLPWDEIFAAVHCANMQKVPLANNEEGKRLNKLDVRKPEGWTPPDVAGILTRYQCTHMGTDDCPECSS